MTVINVLGGRGGVALPSDWRCRPGQPPLESLHVAPQEVLGRDLSLGRDGAFQRSAEGHGSPQE